MTPKPDRATIDFETRSDCPIRDTGSWRYSLDPTTEILVLVFRLPYWDTGRTAIWHPAMAHLGITEGDDFDALSELFAWIMTGGLVEAHSAFFERGIYNNHLVPLGWPAIKWDQWRCSAAKAAAHALPRALEGVGDALGLAVTKDVDGSAVMKKMAKPRKPKKADRAAWAIEHAPCSICTGSKRIESYKKDGSPTKKGTKCPACLGLGYDVTVPVPPMPLLWLESVELMHTLWAYCCQDVLAEEATSDALPDLNEQETYAYLLDQRINERGFMLDREGVEAALFLIDGECAEFNKELFEITGGQVERATQRERVKAWLEDNDFEIDNTQAETIDELLSRVEDPEDVPWHKVPTGNVRRVLELMRALGRSSTAKYVTMMDWICPDDAVHGSMLYHGAGTGRWTGAGVQPHNFPKGSIKIADMEEAWTLIKTRDKARIEAFFNAGIMEILSSALRGAIIPRRGRQFYVADYAAIEARVVLWLAEDEDALNIFRQHRDIYCEMAKDIYGYPCNKKDNPDERALGKIAVLGLGYQMGASKFVESCAAAGITIEEDWACEFEGCGRDSREHKKWERQQRWKHDHDYTPVSEEPSAVKIVNAYREKFVLVKEMWANQEQAAIDAVLNPGERMVEGRMTWFVEGRFLYCELPSKRRLAYPDPEIHEKATPWGEIRPVLTFMGMDTYTRQWKRQTAYGGLLVENQTQAVARDLMLFAIITVEEGGTYETVLSVHDELVAEADIDAGDVKEFEGLVARIPPWAKGCPVEAEGWRGPRYRK